MKYRLYEYRAIDKQLCDTKNIVEFGNTDQMVNEIFKQYGFNGYVGSFRVELMPNKEYTVSYISYPNMGIWWWLKPEEEELKA